MARTYTRRRRRQAGPQDLLATMCILAALLVATLFYGAGTTNASALLGSVIAIGIMAVMTIFTIVYLRARARRRRLLLLTLADVDHMPGALFERYVAELFRAQGYAIRMTPASGDYGVDIIVSKAGQRTAVQVKRYSKPVRQAAIREAIAGMAFYHCSRSMVVTNSVFTRAAQVLARSNNCRLIDREALAELAASVQPH